MQSTHLKGSPKSSRGSRPPSRAGGQPTAVEMSTLVVNAIEGLLSLLTEISDSLSVLALYAEKDGLFRGIFSQDELDGGEEEGGEEEGGTDNMPVAPPAPVADPAAM